MSYTDGVSHIVVGMGRVFSILKMKGKMCLVDILHSYWYINLKSSFNTVVDDGILTPNNMLLDHGLTPSALDNIGSERRQK